MTNKEGGWELELSRACFLPSLFHLEPIIQLGQEDKPAKKVESSRAEHFHSPDINKSQFSGRTQDTCP